MTDNTPDSDGVDEVTDQTRSRPVAEPVEVVGWLGVSRVLKPHSVRKYGFIGATLLDISKPQYHRDLFYLTDHPPEVEKIGAVWALSGNGAKELRWEDRGRRVKVRATFRPNPTSRRYGTLTRVRVEFLDNEETPCTTP